MKLPKMILFDYGHTLIREIPGHGHLNGMTALLQHAASNPNNITVEQALEVHSKVFGKFKQVARDEGVDLHYHALIRFLYDYLDIEIPLPFYETERIYWDNSAPASPMPGVVEMVDYLNERGIRMGVISNIEFSSKAIRDRLDACIPNHQFEFVITSSEYVYRKPNPIIFHLALTKAKLQPEHAWYCGDKPRFDVQGPYDVGMTPVWFNPQEKNAYAGITAEQDYQPPTCEHIEINNWQQLVDVLEQCKG